MKTKWLSLFSLAIGLATIAPTFAHADYRPSSSQRVIAREANYLSTYDLNRNGRVSPYEVRRVQELRRERARAAARAAARARYVERARAEARRDRVEAHYDRWH